MKSFNIQNFIKDDERNVKFTQFLDTVGEKQKELMQYLFNIIKLYKMDKNCYYACGYFTTEEN